MELLRSQGNDARGMINSLQKYYGMKITDFEKI